MSNTPKALLLLPSELTIGLSSDEKIICMLPLFDGGFFTRMHEHHGLATTVAKATSSFEPQDRWNGTEWVPSRIQHIGIRELVFAEPVSFLHAYVNIDSAVVGHAADADVSDFLYDLTDRVSGERVRSVLLEHVHPCIVRFADFDERAASLMLPEFSTPEKRWDEFTKLEHGSEEYIYITPDCGARCVLHLPYVREVNSDKMEDVVRFSFRAHNQFEFVTSRTFDVKPFLGAFEDAFRTI